MPRKKRIPSYCNHKPSGQAQAIIDGEHIYLGEYGSQQSQEKYARLIAERVLTPVSAVAVDEPSNDLVDRSMHYIGGSHATIK